MWIRLSKRKKDQRRCKNKPEEREKKEAEVKVNIMLKWHKGAERLKRKAIFLNRFINLLFLRRKASPAGSLVR
jgi:hypothetical protein